MALDKTTVASVTTAGEAFLLEHRPPEEVRPELDIMYRIENQSVFIHEVRPMWKNPSEKSELPVAKTTYVKRQEHWRVYWMRADLKWHLYEPDPIVDDIEDFFQLVGEDKYGCFFG